jgi:excisionase family DNA binding protein
MPPTEKQREPTGLIKVTHGRPLEMVSVKTLSQMLDMKERTVREWIAKRIVPYHKIGKLVRFNLKEIQEWLQRHRVEAHEPSVLKGKVGL